MKPLICEVVYIIMEHLKSSNYAPLLIYLFFQKFKDFFFFFI